MAGRQENGRMMRVSKEVPPSPSWPEEIERMVGESYACTALQEGVDSDAIEATLKNKVLEVLVPRPAQPKTKAHKVKVN